MTFRTTSSSNNVQRIQIAGVTLEQDFIIGTGQRDHGRAAQHDADGLLADHVQRMQVEMHARF